MVKYDSFENEKPFTYLFIDKIFSSNTSFKRSVFFQFKKSGITELLLVIKYEKYLLQKAHKKHKTGLTPSLI